MLVAAVMIVFILWVIVDFVSYLCPPHPMLMHLMWLCLLCIGWYDLAVDLEMHMISLAGDAERQLAADERSS